MAYGNVNVPGVTAAELKAAMAALQREIDKLKDAGYDDSDLKKTIADIEKDIEELSTALKGKADNTVMKGAGDRASGAQGLVPAPTAGQNYYFLRGDGAWTLPTESPYAIMQGADESTAGHAGFVPAPAAGDQGKFLRGDGTWASISNSGTTMNASAEDYINYANGGGASAVTRILYRIQGSENLSTEYLQSLTAITYNGEQYALSDYLGNALWSNYLHGYGFCGSTKIMVIFNPDVTASHMFSGTAQTTGIFVDDPFGTVTLGDDNSAHPYSAADLQTIVGKYAGSGAAAELPDVSGDGVDGTLFAVGTGTSDLARSIGLRVAANNAVYLGASFANGANFAEFYEWADGNPDGEDRRGRFVALDGEKIRLAGASDRIWGIVSAYPGSVGDAYEDYWQGMYLKDVFGAPLVETVEILETFRVENGETVIVPAHTERRMAINPDYDPYTPYVPRSKRKEWSYVAYIGKLVMVDDGSCTPGGWCKPAGDGAAAASAEETSVRVMCRIDENHIKVCFNR